MVRPQSRQPVHLHRRAHRRRSVRVLDDAPFHRSAMDNRVPPSISCIHIRIELFQDTGRKHQSRECRAKRGGAHLRTWGCPYVAATWHGVHSFTSLASRSTSHSCSTLRPNKWSCAVKYHFRVLNAVPYHFSMAMGSSDMGGCDTKISLRIHLNAKI